MASSLNYPLETLNNNKKICHKKLLWLKQSDIINLTCELLPYPRILWPASEGKKVQPSFQPRQKNINVLRASIPHLSRIVTKSTSLIQQNKKEHKEILPYFFCHIIISVQLPA